METGEILIYSMRIRATGEDAALLRWERGRPARNEGEARTTLT
jgi:hypothetical protein